MTFDIPPDDPWLWRLWCDEEQPEYDTDEEGKPCCDCRATNCACCIYAEEDGEDEE